MPDEYISREAALTALQDSDLFNTTERQLRAIRELPAANVAEVVHGRWIWNEEGEIDWEQFYRCSNCGDKEYWESNFCPNCGAKMDTETIRTGCAICTQSQRRTNAGIPEMRFA